MPRTGESSPQKGKKFEKEVYSVEEIDRLLEHLNTSPTGRRNKALICTLWQGGLRIAEALDLVPSDVDLNRGEIHVRHGKGDKARRVVIGPDAVSSIQLWMTERARLGIEPSAPLFCTLAGAHLHDTYVRGMLNRLAKKARWEKRIHPHGFRHTFAVNLARNNMPIPMIQRQLGHSSLATTSVYLAAISNEDVAQAMEKVSWR